MNAHPWRQRLYHLVLWVVAIVFFLPVLWIFLAAFKSGGELVSAATRCSSFGRRWRTSFASCGSPTSSTT